MLQDIRKNIKGTTAKIVVGVIVLSFSLFGIESILLGGGSSGIAEVNGEEISPQELQLAVLTQKSRMRSMFGDSIDQSMLSDDRLRPAALEGLIGRKLMVQSAADMNLSVSDSEIGRMVSSMEQFQIAGQFSTEAYVSALAQAGHTPASFRRVLEDDVVVSQLRSGLAGTEFITTAEAQMTARISSEQRDVRYLTIELEKFVAAAIIDDAQIEAWYQANQESFLTEESVELDYLQLNIDDFREPVEESAVLEEYELEKQNYQYQTENRVSHILIEPGVDEAGESAELRLSAAQTALTAGEDFAAVARQYSDDVGSAGNGGDLGFSSGDAFPEEMEEAIAALEPNNLSAPVETSAGTHLIIVTERRDGEAPSLEELRFELEERIQTQSARVELLLAVESLKNLTFNAEDLAEPAKELDLDVLIGEAITRTDTAGLLADPRIIAAAFSEDVLEFGHNSEVIELGNDSFIALRVRTHNLPVVKELAGVRDQITATLTDNAARAEVAAAAEQAVIALRAGATVENYATLNQFEWQVELGASRRSQSVPAEVLQRVFQLPVPAADSTIVEYVTTESGDALVLELVRVSAGDYAQLPLPAQEALKRQVTGEYGNLIDSEFRDGIRSSAEITVL